MEKIAHALEALRTSLCQSVDIGGLFSRNRIAHKWKAPFRSLSLREGIAWRTQDLLAQSLSLYDSQHILGARILLRSAFETVAVLIYLNQLTQSVLDGSLDFHDYSRKTETLLLGSRDQSTSHTALNIVTILKKCNARYPGIESLYAALSESAHPNYEGVSVGYSKVDRENYITTYSNRWSAMHGPSHIDSMLLCLDTFVHEYNEEWTQSFELLEEWITEHDTILEQTKRSGG
jgi:hypothetical protein